MIDKKEIQKYLLIEVGESVQYQTETWYCVTTLNDAGITLVYNGLGRYQGEAPRRIYIPFCDMLSIYEEDGTIVAESKQGLFELRKAYTVEEMQGLKKVEEKPTFSLTELLELC